MVLSLLQRNFSTAKANGIRHTTVAPYHPRSNGLAERFVQTFKASMKKMTDEGSSLNKKLANFLLTYRKTPQSTTMEAPSMLLMKRIPRSKIDLITPDLQRKVAKKQESQKKNFDRNTRPKEFQEQETVWARNYRGSEKWLPGVIDKKTGPVSYQVQVKGMRWRRHAEQLRKRDQEQSPEPDAEEPILVPDPPATDTPVVVASRRSTRTSRQPARLTYPQPGTPVE